MPLTETKNWWPLKLTFPIMISFDYYEEIEEMRHTLSTLLNTKLECFELGDGDVKEEEEMGVKLVKHTGDFYVGLQMQHGRAGYRARRRYMRDGLYIAGWHGCMDRLYIRENKRGSDFQ